MSVAAAMSWILRPVRLCQCRTLRQFILRVLGQQLAVKVAVAIPIGLFVSDNSIRIVITNPALVIIGTVFLAPVIETILLQALPIELVRRFRGPRWLQYCAGAVPFALLHFTAGVAVGIAAGVVGGIFFAHSYLEGRKDSWQTAAVVTCVVHALHNLIVLPIMFATASFA